ncbi:MAG: PAS domain-containing protein [Methylobacteriaceae bacterium]|nr:PAS domain-containing protein [Methylobacteriaceae bacterium]
MRPCSALRTTFRDFPRVNQTISERALILAPRGRDAAIAAAMLAESDIHSLVARDIEILVAQLRSGAGFAVVTEEALRGADLHSLAAFIEDQEEWSDFPFILLTERGGGLERNPAAGRFLETLGNVTFLERPFHPTTLVSLARAALRARRRQYEARSRLQEIREGEEELRIALAAGRLGAWTFDLDANALDASPTCKANFGRTVDDPFTYDDLVAAIHPDDRDYMLRSVEESLANGSDYDVEYRCLWPDNSLHWVQIRGRPTYDLQGKPLRMTGVSQDVTEQKHAEAALRESERQFRSLADSIPTLCWMAEADGYIFWYNSRWYDYTGTLPADMEGWGWQAVHDPDLLPEVMERWKRSIASGDPFEMVFPLKGADGIFKPFLTRIVPIRDDRGVIVKWFGTNTDISTQQQAENALRDLAAELEKRVEERTQELMAAEEALRQSQKMEAVGQLTGGLAHDFNNLLTGISGSLQLLQTRLSQGRVNDLERYINAADGAARRAASLTHRLLAFSRRQTLDPKPTNINRLVVGLEELIRRTVGPGIQVEVVGAAGLWTALVDRNQLENAVLNLCINARDAMPDGGRLTIETANKWLDERAARQRELAPGQYLSLCVTDTGTGMTPDVIKRAFDPFFTTKPLGQGTGLGLSMIYGFARQSGGQVRIYSELGKGTTMCLYLPRHHGRGEDDDISHEWQAKSQAADGETVLVVDDEPTVRMLVTEVLQELGYTAIEVADGSTGLQVLRSDQRIDLLITDVGLPGGINGRQVADGAREVRPDLKVLFITGYAENAVVGNGHLEPGMQVLAKPFPMEALATRIRDLMATT